MKDEQALPGNNGISTVEETEQAQPSANDAADGASSGRLKRLAHVTYQYSKM